MVAQLARPGEAARPLSPSQVLKYLNCSASWHYEYVAQLPQPATSSLALGKALHSAAQATLSAKKEGDALHVDHVIADILPAELERELASAELREEESAADLHQLAAALYREWHASALPFIDPLEIEYDVEGEIAGIAVRGRVDVVDKSGCVIDLKTATKAPSEISAAHQFQLATYAYLTGAPSYRVVTVTKTKTPRVIPHTRDVQTSDVSLIHNLFPIVADAMAQGFAIPNRQSMFCSRKNCAFWCQCEAEYGGEVKP